MRTLIKKTWLFCRARFRQFICRELVAKLSEALQDLPDEIPVFVISYQNSRYVENIVNQLNSFGIKPIIIDNNSKDLDSLKILKELEMDSRARVVRGNRNLGNKVGFLEPVYQLFPDVFAYTDPDLKLSDDLPANFLSVLADLTVEYSVYKAGFALDLLPQHKITNAIIRSSTNSPFFFTHQAHIREWENAFWRFRISDNPEVYAASIDTTFAVYRKTNYFGDFYDSVRIAGPFSCVHLPWFPEIDILSGEAKDAYLAGNKITTWVTPPKDN